ncbi:formin-like protein 6 [Ananas comosus]|uniref:Formin-like protein 6 n=1 Tax=Ananas comosus TaxID=4615 RepID=A0A6P5GMJ2_ANACO|nr:formin-like protein 6 [Ananas comosus]
MMIHNFGIIFCVISEEMQAVSKGPEKVEQELTASENDGRVSETFRKTLKTFLNVAEAEVRALTSLYSNVGRNADALALYFGEGPARCPFEQDYWCCFKTTLKNKKGYVAPSPPPTRRDGCSSLLLLCLTRH